MSSVFIRPKSSRTRRGSVSGLALAPSGPSDERRARIETLGARAQTKMSVRLGKVNLDEHVSCVTSVRVCACVCVCVPKRVCARAELIPAQ